MQVEIPPKTVFQQNKNKEKREMIKNLIGAIVAFLLVSFNCETSLAQGPLRRLGHAIVEHQPVRSAIRTVVQAQPVRTTVRTIVQEKPVRTALYQTVVAAKSYGSTGTNYGSSGTAYGYGSSGTTSYRVVSTTTYSCPCGPNCQCDVGGTPCPCPKTASTECVDCKTKGTEPPKPPVGSSEPVEYSGEEVSDNFHRSVVEAIREAQKEGKISRLNAFAIRGAMHLPSFKAKVKETVVAQAKQTGMIPVGATPEEVGKIDFSKIDWIGLIKALIPIILTFL